MDNSLNLVCQTFTGYDIPEEVLQTIKKFMIVPQLDKIFTRDDETLWKCMELLELKYNQKYYPHTTLHHDTISEKPFPQGFEWFDQLITLTDGSSGVLKIKDFDTELYNFRGLEEKINWYIRYFRNRFLFELLYNLPTMNKQEQSVVIRYKEDIDKEILSLTKPELGHELDDFIRQRNKRKIYTGYYPDKGYDKKPKPRCWTLQDPQYSPNRNNGDRVGYYTQSGQLKKNKKIQKDFLNTWLACREVFENSRYSYKSQSLKSKRWFFVKDSWENETLDKKVGREWLLEDKLDSKTLLRIYGGIRPTYEDSVKKSLESMSNHNITNSTP
eukprot:COSAG02_NODE_1023_length_15151_cov_745.123572_3_plen_328_part_00